jgi:hypothetical protein
MQTMDPIDVREAEIARLARSEPELMALQQHLKEIIEGPAFKGSHRSGQFLKYIVDQSIAGHFELLKERRIGVELFGRSPSYDTGEDAIVRVTASDVRKRLQKHYGRNGAASEFRFTLPLGSYIPEITRDERRNAGSDSQPEIHAELAFLSPRTAELNQYPLPASEDRAAAQAADQISAATKTAGRRWSGFLLLGILLLAAVCIVVWSHTAGTPAAPALPAPWSILLKASHPTHLITSDPDIVVVQEITGSEIGVSDYANHKYVPDQAKLTPEEIRIYHSFLWRDYSAAAIDAPIAARVAVLAAENGKVVDVRASRSVQFADLKTDDNFIFLGSPRSDPWASLFSDQLDFRFVFDKAAGQEIIEDVRRRPNEMASYVPTALGWATGQSYAIIAFLQNPDTNGHVLLVAGANAEGTEAAGRLITDLPRLSEALGQCGFQPARSVTNFELLLRLNTMAGSPSHVDVVACHILGSNPSN